MLRHLNLWKTLFWGMPINGAELDTQWARHLPSNPNTERSLEVCRAYLMGFTGGLMDWSDDGIRRTLRLINPEHQGFSREGVAMAIVLGNLPFQARGAARLRAYSDWDDGHWNLLLNLGAGMGCGMLNLDVHRYMASQEPLLSWYLVDGVGFHDGIMQTGKVFERRWSRRQLSATEQYFYDHGVGRAAWFSTGINVDVAISWLGRLERSRQPGLWAGLAFASTYAGRPGAEALRRLLKHSGEFANDVLFGCAMACYQRHVSKNVAAHVSEAAQVFLGASVSQVADLVLPLMDEVRRSRQEPAAMMERFRAEVTQAVLTLSETPRVGSSSGPSRVETAAPAAARR